MHDPKKWTQRLLLCSAGLAVGAASLVAVAEPEPDPAIGTVASNGLTFVGETGGQGDGGGSSGNSSGGTGAGTETGSPTRPTTGPTSALRAANPVAAPNATSGEIQQEGGPRIPLQQIRDYNRAGLNCATWEATQDFIARMLAFDAANPLRVPGSTSSGGIGEDIGSGGLPTRGSANGASKTVGRSVIGPKGSRGDGTVGTQGFAFASFNYRPIPVPFGVDGPDVDLAREPVFGASAADNDGDGLLDRVANPFPNNPAIVFYSFLETQDLQVIFDEGTDNLNTIGALDPTQTDDPMTPENEALLEMDGLPEFWPSQPLTPGFVLRRHYIPNPGDIDDFDIEPGVNAAIQALGLGPTLWPPTRAAFLAGTFSEAVWVFAQTSRQRPGDGFNEVIGFTSTLDGGRAIDVGDPLRLNVNAAIRIIELAGNVKFVERPRTRGVDVFGTPIPLPYPFEASGDAYNPQSTGLFPFGQAAGEQADDYPWVLILRTINGEREAVDGFGVRRGPVDIDYLFDDIDADGHPDFVDSDADLIPDLIIPTAFIPPTSNAPPGPNGLPLGPNTENTAAFVARAAAGNFGAGPDLNGNTLADEYLLPFLQFDNGTITAAGLNWQGNNLFDANGDLVPDSWDRDQNGIADDFDGVDANADGIPDGNGNPDPIPLIIANPGTPGPGQALYLGVQEPQPIITVRLDTDSGVVDGLHYLLHVLGFLHEHQRPDRDQFITVNFANILDTFISDYNIFNATQDVQNLGVTIRTDDYDFESVMHFPPNRGSNGRGPTFTVRPEFGNFAQTVGRGTGLSEGDIRTLAVLFGGNPTAGDPDAWFLGRDPLCPVDVDGDGSQTPADITAYRELWEALDPQADTVDGDNFPMDVEPFGLTGQDGLVDFNDLQRFFDVLQATGFGPCTGAGTPSSAENRARFLGTVTLPG